MNSMNASGSSHCQQWRNDIGMRNLPTHESHREAIANYLNRNHLVAGTICCSRSDCDKIKWEQIEKLFRREGGSPVFPQCPTFQACRDNPGTKKDANGLPENFAPAYCPCMINRGHLITYCCTRRDCDDATKIGGRPERTPAFGNFKC